MEKIIEKAWIELLLKATKKQETPADAENGDVIDLFVPQSRFLSLVKSNRAVPKLMYLSAQESARKNAYLIVRKLGMPSDYFWKFEFWTEERAFSALAKIIHRIFSTIMSEAREGKLVVKELSINPLQVHIDFESCAECAGINGMQHGICYYHAGTFAGIVAALLNLDDMDCYETDCHARGNECCSFILGNKTDKDFVRKFDDYLSPPDIQISLADRLLASLKKDNVRSLGNMVDVNYLRLVTANILLDNPRLFMSVNSEVGRRSGHDIAEIIKKYYNVEQWQSVKNYLRDFFHLSVEIRENGQEIQIAVRETSPEIFRKAEISSFLVGELQGLISGLTGKEMRLKESVFRDDYLLVILVP